MSNVQRGRRLSVVVPCFNEEAVIGQTHCRLSAALAGIGLEFEILYVDDGSRDATLAQLRDIQAGDVRVRILALARNFGHQMAVTAGLDHATGDAVVLIDADLQDPPEVIAQMVERWQAGYDVVYGQRTERDGETRFKLLTASLFYRLINGLSDTPIPVDTGDFRLMDRRVVEALKQMPEHDRFLRGMVSWVGFRQTPLPYRRHERAAGESKYPFWKMVRFATDGILSFSLKPLRLALSLGFAATSLAIIIGLYSLATWLLVGTAASSTALVVAAVAFLGGVQLICTGIVGEYVGRIYRENKGRPLYLLGATYGLEETQAADNAKIRRAA